MSIYKGISQTLCFSSLPLIFFSFSKKYLFVLTCSTSNALHDEEGLVENLNIVQYLSYCFHPWADPNFLRSKWLQLTIWSIFVNTFIDYTHIKNYPESIFTILQNSIPSCSDSIAKIWIKFSERHSHQTVFFTKDTFRERLGFREHGCRQTQSAHPLNSFLLPDLPDCSQSLQSSHVRGFFFFLLCFNFCTESNRIEC